jgi:orotidine-5'-phosphate decarboxylase
MNLVVALDRESLSENLALVQEIKGFPVWVKVGLRSFIRDGWKIIHEIRNIDPNLKIFLDLKLYDIPNTMADASEEIAENGIEMFNIHASAGVRAMKEVMKRLERFENRPLVLSVTALTSFNENEFKDVYNNEIVSKALQFSKWSYESGLDGVVSSVWESNAIKKETSSEFLTLTPGIRPFGENANDQQRVADLKMARKEESDFIVVGRPIYKSSNPKEVIQRILEEIKNG